jgi:hypothetical protein
VNAITDTGIHDQFLGTNLYWAIIIGIKPMNTRGQMPNGGNDHTSIKPERTPHRIAVITNAPVRRAVSF